MSGEAKTDAKAGRTIPFFKATIGEEEIASVVETLRSGWLTSGPKCVSSNPSLLSSLGPNMP